MYARHAISWPSLARLIDYLPRLHLRIHGTFAGYAWAVLLVGLGWLSRIWVGPAEVGLPLLTFYSAAALATLLLGIGPGIFAAILGAVVGSWQYMPPYGELSFSFAPGSITSNVIYFANEAMLCLAVLAMRRHFERYRANRELLGAIVESSQDAIQVIDQDGRFRFVNDAAAQRLGQAATHMQGQMACDFISLDEPLTSISNLEYRLHCADGVERTYLSTRGPLRDAQRQHVGYYLIDRDITALRQADEHLRMSAQVFEMTLEGLMITDAEQQIIMVNPAFCRLTGYRREDVVGQRPRLMRSGRHGKDYYQQLRHALDIHGHWEGEIWNRRRDGQIALMWLSISTIRNASGELSHHIAVYREITVARDAQTRMTWLATHDELTGLGNRILLGDQLQQAVSRVTRHKQQLAVLLIDIDNFKFINDSLGHEIGDALLLQIAGRLRTCLRICDPLARMGGDEFAIILEDTDQERIHQTAQCIVTQLALPYLIGDNECYATASIGISLLPDDASTPAELLSHADSAMYRAKESGKSTYQFFSGDMVERSRQRLDLEHGLRRALARRELYLEYQPQVDLHSRELIGVEALLRWRHDGRNISPLEFIPVAEETHLIIDIGEWVLAETCRQLHLWETQGLPAITVSVNISTRHFLQPDMVSRLHNIVQEAGIAPSRICIEVTEGAMQDVDAALALLNDLSALGFATSVDDFGTGFSSLSHLKRLPLNELKIDRSFVNGIVDDHNDHAITSAIIAMAGKLELRVVAEGIETAAQLGELKNLGCGIGQGYLFSRPLPGDRLPPWLHAQSAATAASLN